MKLKPYKKDDGTSYTLGVFPTLELLNAQPTLVQRVLVSTKIKQNDGLQKLQAACEANKITIEQTDPALMQRLSRSENCFAIGVFKKHDQVLEATEPHIVLVNPDDMGNLGTIMRTALGFGTHNIAIITPAADAYDPKTVRASMGALFRMRLQHFGSFADYRAAFPAHSLYTFALDGSQKLADVNFTGPSSLVFGNEGSGLPADIAAQGTPVRIEQTADVDSLNLALSVGVALYKRYISGA